MLSLGIRYMLTSSNCLRGFEVATMEVVAQANTDFVRLNAMVTRHLKSTVWAR